jgi:hypothetical protein
MTKKAMIRSAERLKNIAPMENLSTKTNKEKGKDNKIT